MSEQRREDAGAPSAINKQLLSLHRQDENSLLTSLRTMHTALQANHFFVKRQPGILKAANNYDIFDPLSQEKTLECREPNLGFFAKLLPFADFKRVRSFDIQVHTPSGQKVLSIRRGTAILLSTIEVLDANNHVVGYFRSGGFLIGPKFDLLDIAGKRICNIQGKWPGWDFRYFNGSTEIASLSKTSEKEMFPRSVHFMLSINESVAATDRTRLLIVAAVMCIDMVLKDPA